MNDILLLTRYLNRIIIATAFAFAVLSMASCSTHRSVTDQSVRTTTIHDTLRLTQYRVSRDSIYLHDSVRIEVKGDTVRYTLYRDRWHYGTDTLHDTVYVNRAKADTVATTHTSSTTKEVHLSVWETIRNYLICAMLIALAAFGVRWWMRRYTNGTD